MLKLKTFTFANDKEAEKFMEAFAPMGKNGLVLHNSSIVINYEDGELLPIGHKIQNLRSDLRAKMESIFEQEKLVNMDYLNRTNFDRETEKKNWKSANDILNTHIAILDLEIKQAKVLMGMIIDLKGDISDVVFPAVPEKEIDTTISPYGGSDSRKNKK